MGLPSYNKDSSNSLSIGGNNTTNNLSQRSYLRIKKKLAQQLPNQKLQEKIINRIKEGANNEDINNIYIKDDGAVMDFNENLM